MNTEFKEFLESLPSPNQPINEEALMDDALQQLWQPLALYLANEQRYTEGATLDFAEAVSIACKLRDPDTGNHFWGALQALQSGSWLKFVNVIERLQQYAGSQVFPINNIRQKRRVRLYLALALSWEHLRYLAGKDDDYSPSTEIMERYGVELDDHEH